MIIIICMLRLRKGQISNKQMVFNIMAGAAITFSFQILGQVLLYTVPDGKMLKNGINTAKPFVKVLGNAIGIFKAFDYAKPGIARIIDVIIKTPGNLIDLYKYMISKTYYALKLSLKNQESATMTAIMQAFGLRVQYIPLKEFEGIIEETAGPLQQASNYAYFYAGPIISLSIVLRRALRDLPGAYGQAFENQLQPTRSLPNNTNSRRNASVFSAEVYKYETALMSKLNMDCSNKFLSIVSSNPFIYEEYLEQRKTNESAVFDYLAELIIYNDKEILS